MRGFSGVIFRHFPRVADYAAQAAVKTEKAARGRQLAQHFSQRPACSNSKNSPGILIYSRERI
ncbi:MULTISPECIES: hypothetical protein [Desulfitobacterium]|uniref:hypothetical protein n=1 Tax=Desulfitobacterium TaxID=36853 RepID=UPI00031766CC|nr:MULTISPECIES: hypothetical protein [Desulfitobacterium]